MLIVTFCFIFLLAEMYDLADGNLIEYPKNIDG